jgi:hypothetical protein
MIQECNECKSKTMTVEPSVVYIAGPISGIPEYNFPAFYEAEDLIRMVYPNSLILNPAKMDIDSGFDPNSTKLETTHDLFRMHRDCMGRDVNAILDNTPDTYVRDSCLLVLLDNYHNSRGVLVELSLCTYLDWSVTSIAQFRRGK